MTTEIALITAYDGQGRLLVGKRNDSGKWTLPGGHLEPGEDPREAARRELWEETGLHAQSLSTLTTYTSKKGVVLHAFSAYVSGEPHGNNDPDDECEHWEFLDVTDGIPPKVWDHLHGPEDDDNLVRKVFEAAGMQKSEALEKMGGQPAGITDLNDLVSPERFRELGKAEDEVERLLDHPSVPQRTLALKLSTISPRHLQLASLDPHPAVHQLAIDHPQFGHREAMHLMEATAGKDGKYPMVQQHAFLQQHDRVRPYHVAAFVQNARANAPEAEKDQAIGIAVRHPNLPAAVARSLYLDPSTKLEHRLALVGHKSAPRDVLEHAIQTAMIVPSSETAALARAAVSHPLVPTDTVDHLVRSAGDRGEPHVVAIAEHALRSNAVPPALKEYVFQQALLKPRAPASRALLNAFLAGPSVSAPDVQRALAQTLNKSEALAKAVRPEHFSSIVKALDPEAHKLVDHKPDLAAHPPAHGAEVEAYHGQVLTSSRPIGARTSGSAGLGEGITRKKVFTAQVAGSKDPVKFMVKPYHERVIQRCKKWMQFPIQGWAEMTNQALYHAAGIGHLHQKVHVAEHDMGPGHEHEPALVVHIAPNHKAVCDGGGNSFGGEKNREDVRKIALMDFLANNSDRHSGNLMVNQETGAPLAIDQSRNFQYVKPRNDSGLALDGDQFGSYHREASITNLEPFLDNGAGSFHDRQMDLLERYAPTIQWWGEVGDKVRKAFHDRLDQIKDPEVRDHLKRNFDARADWLDERAHFGLGNYGTDWYHDAVPMYRPDEMSEAEKDDPEAVARFEARIRSKAEAKRKISSDKRKSKKAYKDWLDSKPKYPHHLGDLPPEQREVHPEWKQYAAAYDPWMARRPQEAA
jgi:8-oxo-dGTP pyrophosphatase MutT (NUDIX family)